MGIWEFWWQQQWKWRSTWGCCCWGISVCAIYESDNWKAELEHENDEASSDNVSSECDNDQDTVQVAVPREVRTDEGTLYSYVNCLNPAAVNAQVVFLAKFPTREARRSHKRHTFLENLGLQLLWPWLEKRKEVPWLPKADGYSESPLVFPETELRQLTNSRKNTGDATSVHPHSEKQWSGAWTLRHL